MDGVQERWCCDADLRPGRYTRSDKLPLLRAGEWRRDQRQHLLVAQTAAHLATAVFFNANWPMQSDLEGTAMIHAQLYLFFWLLITFLTLQAIFLTWRCRSVLVSLAQLLRKVVGRQCHCVWCWDAWHLRRWYPERWSSTMCAYHHHEHTRQLQARRSARQTARLATQPPSPALVHQAHSEYVDVVEVLS